MAITKRTENDKIEVINKWNVQVRTATVIEEDGVELSRSYHRHTLSPWASSYDPDTKKWTHTATDISGEDADVRAIANAAWTDANKTAAKTEAEATS
tara:strand:+ start:1072 stop:1362 length:291 start_codon:yes stop_codon:yes gene_type:complete